MLLYIFTFIEKNLLPIEDVACKQSPNLYIP